MVDHAQSLSLQDPHLRDAVPPLECSAAGSVARLCAASFALFAMPTLTFQSSFTFHSARWRAALLVSYLPSADMALLRFHNSAKLRDARDDLGHIFVLLTMFLLSCPPEYEHR